MTAVPLLYRQRDELALQVDSAAEMMAVREEVAARCDRKCRYWNCCSAAFICCLAGIGIATLLLVPVAWLACHLYLI
jgi:hypothetical protein